MAWQVTGRSMEMCNCKQFCPCWLGPEGEPDGHVRFRGGKRPAKGRNRGRRSRFDRTAGMSALGQERTFGDTARKVCSWR